MRVHGRPSFGSRLRALRLDRGLSQVDLSRAIGRHQTAIGPYERDEYAPSPEIVERLAATLETSPEYLLFGRDTRRPFIAPFGRMGAMGFVDQDEIARPLVVAEEHLLAVTVMDDAMAPVIRPGQVLLIRASPETPLPLLGRDVIAELEDGRMLVRRLLPSAEIRRFDLGAYNAPPLTGIELRSVRLIVGVLWNEALMDDTKE